MIKIENSKFSEKFTEINIRQRMYENESFITLIINTEFFPTIVGDNVVSGNIEIKLDVNDIKSLDDLVGKNYSGDIGKVTISVNNDGVWEHDTKDNFELIIKERKGRNLKFSLKTDNCKLETTGVMVSLYTTSISEKSLKENFDLNDFYDKAIIKEIGSNKIFKYIVKE